MRGTLLRFSVFVIQVPHPQRFCCMAKQKKSGARRLGDRKVKAQLLECSVTIAGGGGGLRLVETRFPDIASGRVGPPPHTHATLNSVGLDLG